jgi:class 3 adenylate cyclase
MTTDSATFLFADLAGFTALTEAHGDEQAADLVGEFSDKVRELVGDAGSLIKTIGDAVMARFPEAADAIAAGVRIATELGRGHGAPAVRVGMHHGPAVERGGDWFGGTVNVAARVAALASAGEVLLTEATLRAAGELNHVRFARHGTHRLRNLAEPIDVLRVVPANGLDTPLEIDPVCRMAVDPAHAAGRLHHEGREYLFCSLGCAGRFAADPVRYVGDATRRLSDRP